jgi:hypothetical protein
MSWASLNFPEELSWHATIFCDFIHFGSSLKSDTRWARPRNIQLVGSETRMQAASA